MRRIIVMLNIFGLYFVISSSCKEKLAEPKYLENDSQLFNLIEGKDNEKAINIIDKGIDLTKNKYAFHAAKTGNTEVLHYLLSKGASVEKDDINNYTFLMALVQGGLFEEVQKYIDKMSLYELNAKTTHGISLLNLAMQNNYYEIVKILVDKGISVEKEHLFLCSNSSKACEYILEKESLDLNVTNEKGATPLIIAVSSGNVESVAILLKRGADKNKKTINGETARDILEKRCAFKGEIVGANINEKTCESIEKLLSN